MCEFFGLGALQIRGDLIDLARRFRGPEGPARNEVKLDTNFDQATSSATGPAAASSDLDQWCAFHQAVDGLPAEECEVVGLIAYHGWTQEEVAELFQVTEHTVRRW
jgi:RNA polymerase sigma factor (sigma-70 family)